MSKTETAREKPVNTSASYTLIYNVELDGSKKLYLLLDKLHQHWGPNSYNYDLRVFLPAQEVLVKTLESTVWGRFYKLAKPLTVRVEMTQVRDGDPMAMVDLANRLKADARWTVTAIKDSVV